MHTDRPASAGPAPLAPDYAEARRRCTSAASGAGADLASFRHDDETGPDGCELAIDVATLGPRDGEAALLVVSGTHGVEGFAGSALQSEWLERIADQPLPAGLRTVLVHALNPYGFAWTRRTNEDNVDLNRNFIDWDGPLPVNTEYEPIAALLVPERWDDATRESTTLALLAVVDRIGWDAMQRAVSAGQYRHPGGVFYGGSGPVWSRRWLDRHLAEIVGPARRVGVIDLHTGLGPWGHGELIVDARRGDPAYEGASQWWGDVRSMQDGDSVSSNLSGDWLGSIDDILPGAEVTAAALEYGTVEVATVLQALRGEAWLHQQDSDTITGPDGDRVRGAVRAAFADDDPAWLAALSPRFTEVADAAIDRLTS